MLFEMILWLDMHMATSTLCYQYLLFEAWWSARGSRDAVYNYGHDLVQAKVLAIGDITGAWADF